jgi:hypothetical protein
MKKSLVIAFVALGILAGQALAARHTSTPRTVTVVMHDPGCHWFAVGGKFLTKLTVEGPIALANLDMSALKVAGASGVKLDGVGKRIALARGTYRITMVGQAPDDNTLLLTVR